MGGELTKIPSQEEYAQAEHLRRSVELVSRFYVLQQEPAQLLVFNDATCSVQVGVMLLDGSVVTDIPNIVAAGQVGALDAADDFANQDGNEVRSFFISFISMTEYLINLIMLLLNDYDWLAAYATFLGFFDFMRWRAVERCGS